mgnify:CR=1 FL=1
MVCNRLQSSLMTCVAPDKFTVSTCACFWKDRGNYRYTKWNAIENCLTKTCICLVRLKAIHFYRRFLNNHQYYLSWFAKADGQNSWFLVNLEPFHAKVLMTASPKLRTGFTGQTKHTMVKFTHLQWAVSKKKLIRFPSQIEYFAVMLAALTTAKTL